MTEWKEVNETKFYKVIGPQDVHPRIVSNSWPYTSAYVTPRGEERGRVIEAVRDGSAMTERRYMFPHP